MCQDSAVRQRCNCYAKQYQIASNYDSWKGSNVWDIVVVKNPCLVCHKPLCPLVIFPQNIYKPPLDTWSHDHSALFCMASSAGKNDEEGPWKMGSLSEKGKLSFVNRTYNIIKVQWYSGNCISQNCNPYFIKWLTQSFITRQSYYWVGMFSEWKTNMWLL